MSEQDTFKRAWDEYQRIVMSPHAEHLQVTQTRRAFYAGAIAYARRIHNYVAGEEDSDAALRSVNALSAELNEFAAMVTRAIEEERRGS